ncbi:MAG: cytochrome c3 family protein [Verrucomicrobiota bacterium]|nr:cytochrome c3 family protein [Verrucomicrobiota bacterium]
MKIDRHVDVRGKSLLWIGVLLLTGWVLFSQFRPAPQDHAKLDSSPESGAMKEGDSPSVGFSPTTDASEHFQDTLPIHRGPDGYIGESQCKECHESEHQSWYQTYHRTMTQVMTPESVQADFDNVSLDYFDEVFSLQRKDDDYWVRISDRVLDVEAQDVSGGGEEVQFRMGLVTGSHHMQVFWMPAFFGNMQIGFPFTWLIKDQRWVPRNATFIRDPHTVPSPEVWNVTCIRCHVTAGVPKHAPQKDITLSEVADMGISCEACHGPGEAHVAWQREKQSSESTGSLPPAGADPIIHPEFLDASRSTQLCGQCHGMKWWDDSEAWSQHGFTYRPGDDLNETTPIVQPSKIDSLPWLQAIIQKHPNLLRDFFWSDGMMRVSGREYNGLLDTACHQRGEMSCISCHSMHDSDPNDMLADRMEGNQACLQCHDSFQEDIQAHTHHPADSEGSLCYNCHMPHTSYALLSAIRSHQVDSPDTLTSLETGRPNACNLCHVDQPLHWTSKHLHQWYGAPLNTSDAGENPVAAVLEHLLSGDAGQRALAAWHLGWEASKSAAGKHWQPRFLAELLDDPYSAVRYVAFDALRHYEGFESYAYDFVADPETLAQAQISAIEIWEQSVRPHYQGPYKASLLLDSTGQADRKRIAALLGMRNDTPMRLRE